MILCLLSLRKVSYFQVGTEIETINIPDPISRGNKGSTPRPSVFEAVPWTTSTFTFLLFGYFFVQYWTKITRVVQYALRRGFLKELIRKQET
jgi:hypothetical protein